MILDYLILFLPVIPVLKLQMVPVQKALVLSAFALGSVFVALLFHTAPLERDN